MDMRIANALSFIQQNCETVEDVTIRHEPRSGATRAVAKWMLHCYTLDPCCNFIYVGSSQVLAHQFLKELHALDDRRWHHYIDGSLVTPEGGMVMAIGPNQPVCGYAAGRPKTPGFGGAIVIDEGPRCDHLMHRRYSDHTPIVRIVRGR